MAGGRKVYYSEKNYVKLKRLDERLGGYGEHSMQWIIGMGLDLLAAREGFIPIEQVPAVVLAPTPRQDAGDAPMSDFARAIGRGEPINLKALPALKREEGAVLGSLLASIASNW